MITNMGLKVVSSNRGECHWLSELQGGRSAQGFDIHDPVDALSQQRWIWNGLACGADTILFWCWRDEVFTCEAGGYGLIGLDGLAEERIAAMQVTGRVLNEHADIISGYTPEGGTFGVLFGPQSGRLDRTIAGAAARPAGMALRRARRSRGRGDAVTPSLLRGDRDAEHTHAPTHSRAGHAAGLIAHKPASCVRPPDAAPREAMRRSPAGCFLR